MTTTPTSGAPDSPTQPERLDALIRAARTGDGRASCRLGDLYREGERVEQDWDEAFRWYSLGASQGDADAQNNLGTMFLRGAGCLVDEARAVFWYRRSAEQGHATAQANLAKRYLRGEGVAPDLAEAFRWFHAASQQGDAASAWELGTMYRFGRGVERNIVAAADLHLAAAKAGIVAGEVSLGDYFDELQDVALSGNQTASRFLCEMHNLGLGVAENQALTWVWIKWAKAHCKPSDDPGDAMEVDEAYDFYEQWLDEAMRAEGERVIAALLRPVPRMPRERPLPRVRFKRRRMKGAGDERESA
jgi:TPR repeat protein